MSVPLSDPSYMGTALVGDRVIAILKGGIDDVLRINAHALDSVKHGVQHVNTVDTLIVNEIRLASSEGRVPNTHTVHVNAQLFAAVAIVVVDFFNNSIDDKQLVVNRLLLNYVNNSKETYNIYNTETFVKEVEKQAAAGVYDIQAALSDDVP